MRLKFTILAIAFAFIGCGNNWKAVVAKQQVSIFERENEAAFEGSLNREPVKPIAILQKGEAVLVLEDTYGKDYWACKIRLKNKTTGWVLCTSLSIQKQ